MISADDYEIQKKRIIEDIERLKNNLYDENGKLVDAKYFGGGEADRQNKINLLRNYQKQLDDMNNYEPIYGEALKQKETELFSQKEIDAKREKSMDVAINTTNGYKNCPSVYSIIQYPDGEYHYCYILYKGYSDEYKTDFICYYDTSNPKIMFTPVQIKDGILMKNPNHTQEMINKFSKQFMEQQVNKREMSFEDLKKVIPGVMGNTKQYETVPENVIVGYKVPKKFAYAYATKQPPQDSISTINDNKQMYHYNTSGYGIDTIKSMVAGIKSYNPEIDIFIEKTSTTYTKKNYLCNPSYSYIVTMSANINSINFRDIFTEYGQPIHEETIKKCFGKNLSNEDYKQICNIIDSNFVLNHLETTYLDELRRANPDVKIAIIKNNNDKYYIDINPKKHLIKPEIKNPLDEQLIFDFNVGFGGYEVTTKAQNFVKYRCNEKGEFIEENPYIDANGGKQTEVTSVKGTKQNNEIISNSNIRNNGVEDIMPSTHSDVSNISSTVSEEYSSQEKDEENDLSAVVAKMVKNQTEVILILGDYQKQMADMQQQMANMQQQMVALQQQNASLQQQLYNQNTYGENIEQGFKK